MIITSANTTSGKRYCNNGNLTDKDILMGNNDITVVNDNDNSEIRDRIKLLMIILTKQVVVMY